MRLLLKRNREEGALRHPLFCILLLAAATAVALERFARRLVGFVCRRACHTYRVRNTLTFLVVHTFGCFTADRHLLVHMAEIHCVRRVTFNRTKRLTAGLLILGSLTSAHLNVRTAATAVTVADAVDRVTLQFGHIPKHLTKIIYFAGTVTVFTKDRKIFVFFENP